LSRVSPKFQYHFLLVDSFAGESYFSHLYGINVNIYKSSWTLNTIEKEKTV
jgi:hypothetical protein